MSAPRADWLRKVAWSIVDQGLSAFSSLLVTAALARWLAPASYGAFAVGQSTLLFFASLHSALLSEPLLVFGLREHRDRQPAYVASVLRAHMVFSLAMAALFAVAGAVARQLGQRELPSAFFSLALCGSFVPMLSLARRACYLAFRPHTAAEGTGLQLVLVLALGLALVRSEKLTIVSATATIGACSLLASLWLLFRLGHLQSTGAARSPLASHWAHGRWSLPSSGLAWFPNNGALILLPIWSGLEASGAFRVLVTMLMPGVQVSYAVGQLLLPTLVRAREHGTLARTFQRGLLGLSATSLAYAGALWCFGDELLPLVFGARFADAAPLLRPLALFTVLSALAIVLQAALTACELPQRVFAAYAASALFTLAITTWLVRSQGLAGAVYGYLGGYAVVLGVLAWLAPRELWSAR